MNLKTLLGVILATSFTSHAIFEGYYWYRLLFSYLFAKLCKKSVNVLQQTSVNGKFIYSFE